MNKLIKPILETLSKAFSLVGLTLLMGAVAFTVPVVMASHTLRQDAPSFNTGHHQDEANWFLVSNSTKGTGWGTSVTVSPGDVIAFRIFVHNDTCAENDATGNDRNRCPATTAKHTFVKVNLPASGGTVTATIGADNATSISKSLTLTLPAGQTIAYKTDSTQKTQHPFNEFGWRDLNRTEQVQMANNVTTTGLDLGDIPGSYAQSIYLVFQGQVSNVQAAAPAPQVLGAAKELPKAGPESLPQLALAGTAAIGVLLRRFKV